MTQADRLAPPGESLEIATVRALERARALLPDGGEMRTAQTEMAEAVAGVVARGGAIMVRAGTGTGKSLAYLLPVALSGKRAVVATATHTLQAQLANKDLPLVSAVTGGWFTWEMVKGRQNYLCKAALADALEDQPESHGLLRVKDWATTTLLGEREELIADIDGETWAKCSVLGDECPGARRCEHGSGCFAEAARSRARTADIVLVTTRLYAAHLLAKTRMLADHKVAVIDECHHFEADLEAAFGVSITLARAKRVLFLAKRCEILTEEELIRCVNTVDRFALALDSEEVSTFGDNGKTGRLAVSLVDLAMAFHQVAETANNMLDAGQVIKGVGRLARGAERLADDCLRAAEPKDNNAIRYVEGNKAHRVVRVVPTDLDRICNQYLWGRRAVIMCSGDANPILARRLGLPERAYLHLWSPWDWAARAMLYVPEIPSPRSGEAWEAAAIKTISEMVDGAGGRALVLSTSRRMLQKITTELRAGGNHRVLMQGDTDRASLLKTFRDDETSVLVATKSFFTGVDAPGPTLSLVAIDRLPFPAPNDPLIQAKRERLGSGGFAGVDLSEAAVGLNQAVGRLLRSSTDAGLVMVTDPRLVEVSYGKKLLAELPPMRLTRDRQVALRFLRAAIAGLV